MSDLKKESLDEPLKHYAKRDPELCQELWDKMAPPIGESPAQAATSMRLPPERPRLATTANGTPRP